MLTGLKEIQDTFLASFWRNPLIVKNTAVFAGKEEFTKKSLQNAKKLRNKNAVDRFFSGP